MASGNVLEKCCSQKISNIIFNFLYELCSMHFHRMRARCGASCTSGSSLAGEDAYHCGTSPATLQMVVTTSGHPPSGTPSHPSDATTPFASRRSGLPLVSLGSSKRGSGFGGLAGLIGDVGQKEVSQRRVQVRDCLTVKSDPL